MIRTLSIAAALALAANARAQTALPAYPPIAKGPMPSLAPTTPARPIASVDLRYAQAPAPLPRGVARTAVERHAGGLSGGVGVLCGIQPSADDSGIGRARGYNTEGRFVGAKLGFSF